MWDIIDIYSIHISRLFNSLHNKELIQGLIAQTFTIGRKEISKWYSSNKAMEETRTIKLEHKLLLSNGRMIKCDTISYYGNNLSKLLVREFDSTYTLIKEYRNQVEFSGSATKNVAPYIEPEENKGQLAGRTIISNWEDDKGIKKQTIIKYNDLEHIVLCDAWWNGKRIKKEFEYQYDSHNNWIECKEYHDGNYVNLHLCQYKYK